MAAAGLIDAFTLPAHLEAGEPRPHAHEFLVDVRGLGREDVVLEPVHQLEVVRVRASGSPGTA